MIVTLPALIPFTTPLSDTAAILLSLVFHVTFLFVALLGDIVAFNVTVFPTATDLVPLITTLVTATEFLVSVFLLELALLDITTLYVSFFLEPSFAVAVIVTVPFLIPFTTPLLVLLLSYYHLFSK